MLSHKLIVRRNVRQVAKKIDPEKEITLVADEFINDFEIKVENLLLDAIKRAKGNGRKTLLARDV